MSGFHAQLRDRLVATGDTSPGQWNFMADILEHAATEADRWTCHPGDVYHIPDMLDDAVRYCREAAKAAIATYDMEM